MDQEQQPENIVLTVQDGRIGQSSDTKTDDNKEADNG
jgi:hypothetical protein